MLEFMQWPALMFSVVGSWYLSDKTARHRSIGFFLFLLANFCWIAWGCVTPNAYGLILTQMYYIVTSFRGIRNNQSFKN